MNKRSWAARGGWLLFLAALCGAAGCDWLSGSTSDTRVSPFLTDLTVSRFSVLCGQTFTFSFHFDDPQKDIVTLTYTFTSLVNESKVLSKDLSWEPGVSNGAKSVDYSFECNIGNPKGNWSIAVKVKDDHAHESNTLTETINLTSN